MARPPSSARCRKAAQVRNKKKADAAKKKKKQNDERAARSNRFQQKRKDLEDKRRAEAEKLRSDVVVMFGTLGETAAAAAAKGEAALGPACGPAMNKSKANKGSPRRCRAAYSSHRQRMEKLEKPLKAFTLE